jgi:hypothetical protein
MQHCGGQVTHVHGLCCAVLCCAVLCCAVLSIRYEGLTMAAPKGETGETLDMQMMVEW